MQRERSCKAREEAAPRRQCASHQRDMHKAGTVYRAAMIRCRMATARAVEWRLDRDLYEAAAA